MKHTQNLYQRIIDRQNIFAAAYALPGFLKEVGLIGAVKTNDIKLYDTLYHKQFNANNEIIEICRNKLEKIFKNKDSLFKVKVFFKLKKKENGISEYRPIHTTDICTLICLQSIANMFFFDDDFKNGKHRKSPLNCLIPQNFWGNILAEKPEYIYENWRNKYKKYVHASLKKHDQYCKSKQFSYEATTSFQLCHGIIQ